MVKKHFRAIDLFCGCGGFSLGVIQAGWNVVAALDSDPTALATYWYNLGSEETKIIGTIPRRYAKYFTRGAFPGYRASTKPEFPPVRTLFCKSILDVNGWEILEAAGVDHVELVVGSPPCQSFSTMNQRKKKKDFRDLLVFEFGRVILEIQPDMWVMENVPGMASKRVRLPDGRHLLRVFNEMMEHRDWDTYYDIQGMYADVPPDKDSVSKSGG